jgi:hypothetical protein
MMGSFGMPPSYMPPQFAGGGGQFGGAGGTGDMPQPPQPPTMENSPPLASMDHKHKLMLLNAIMNARAGIYPKGPYAP